MSSLSPWGWIPFSVSRRAYMHATTHRYPTVRHKSPPLASRFYETPLLSSPSNRNTSSSASPSPKRPLQSPKPPPFPTIPTCPSPTCACTPTPELPEGFEIDHTKNLNGTMAAYAEQVLICTGKEDWSSRIEEDNSGDNLAADIKELVGRGGIYSDPYNNISILNSSFPSTIHPKVPSLQNTSVYLLPSFKYIPLLPRVSFSSVEALVQGYLLPTKLHSAHDVLSPIHRDRLLRKEAARDMLWGVRDVSEVMVLICGHGGRDQRCGVFGPVLREEFELQMERVGVEVLKGSVVVDKVEGERLELPSVGDGEEGRKIQARVGLISHIGGHKFAGNVILYLPPGLKTKDGEESPLGGKGIWYGRVEPKHVEGIIKESILGGRVIEDLFRGGISKEGEILRL